MKLDETLIFAPQFDSKGLIPVIAQDFYTCDILMLAYMNAEALQKTRETGEAVYWSRSRQKLWKKGETSGHIQKVLNILIDCDQDAILLQIEQIGAACHTGRPSCFYRKLDNERLEFTSMENPI